MYYYKVRVQKSCTLIQERKIRMSVNERINTHIKEAGLKKCFVAEKAGYTPKQFSEMLTGKKKIYVEDLEQICQALNCSPEKFIKPAYKDKAG